MKQGIHTGISFEDYSRWPHVNNSTLTDFARSPAYCKWKRDQPPIPPTDAMRFGSLCHLAVLEPVQFQANPVAPEVNRRTKVGREEWAHYLTLTDLPMTLDEYHRAMSISIAVRAHPRAAELLKAATHIEASMVWTDPATGLGCKGRPDLLADGICADLKLSRNAHPERFPAEVARYGYHRQAAHYLNGLEVLGHGAEVFVIIAVENTPPYECVVYDLHPDAVELGRVEVARLMTYYLIATESDQWIGYPDEVVTLTLPEWKQRELPEQAITMGGEPI